MVATARQLVMRLPLRKKRTLPAALTVTVVAIEMPLNGVPLIDGAEAVPDSLRFVTVMVTVCESESDPSETQVITMYVFLVSLSIGASKSGAGENESTPVELIIKSAASVPVRE